MQIYKVHCTLLLFIENVYTVKYRRRDVNVDKTTAKYGIEYMAYFKVSMYMDRWMDE